MIKFYLIWTRFPLLNTKPCSGNLDFNKREDFEPKEKKKNENQKTFDLW